MDPTILTSALDRGEWWASRSCRFTIEERTPDTHWIGVWVNAVEFTHKTRTGDHRHLRYYLLTVVTSNRRMCCAVHGNRSLSLSVMVFIRSDFMHLLYCARSEFLN
jgi:hypothetical protein